MIASSMIAVFENGKIDNSIVESFAEHFILVDRWSDILVKKNQTANEIYFIAEGYIILETEVDNKKYIRHIAKSGEFITAIDSFINRTESQDILKMVKDSVIYAIHHNDFFELLKAHPELETIFREVITRALIKCQSRITDMLSLKAEAYYEKLIKETPYILQAVPQYELATYLGIQPQSLSRIKAKYQASGNLY